MKTKAFFIILILSLGLLLSSCYSPPEQYTKEFLAPCVPYGLTFGKPCGINWWEGDYKGKAVLIHAVHTHNNVNLEFQFIGER